MDDCCPRGDPVEGRHVLLCRIHQETIQRSGQPRNDASPHQIVPILLLKYLDAPMRGVSTCQAGGLFTKTFLIACVIAQAFDDVRGHPC